MAARDQRDLDLGPLRKLLIPASVGADQDAKSALDHIGSNLGQITDLVDKGRDDDVGEGYVSHAID